MVVDIVWIILLYFSIQLNEGGEVDAPVADQPLYKVWNHNPAVALVPLFCE